jgi:hypothetical protein
MMFAVAVAVVVFFFFVFFGACEMLNATKKEIRGPHQQKKERKRSIK